jgi:hypothetical protein
MFIFLRLIHFFRNGFVKNLSFIDNFITTSYSRFEIYQNKIQNKIIKFNSNNKIRITFDILIKNKYFKYLFSLKNLKKKQKKKIKTIYFYLNIYNFYIQYLKFINYSIYIDVNIDIIDDRRYNKLNKIFNLLEVDGKNLIESLLVVEGKKMKNKHNLYKHLKKKKQLVRTRIISTTKIILHKKVIKNRVCFFISETNICDKTGILSNINNKTYSLYNKLYNLFEFKLNSFKNKLNLNKIRVNTFYNLKININLKVDLLYFNSFNSVDILHILPFKESKIMLFCLSIFCELMYICFSYITFLKIEFINIIQSCFDLINLYKFEIFSFLEFMCIQTFKKDYFRNQLLILSIIKQFLNDNKFLTNFFIKYYNSYNVDILKYLYINDFSEIIKNFRSSSNIFLDSNNSFINFVKTFFNNFILLEYSIYPLNRFLNLNYYLKIFNHKFNNLFKKVLVFQNNKIIQINNDNLELVRPTPLKFKVSIETLSETVKNSSKRGRPRKLSIYQKDILIEEGVLEPLKPLTEKQLYENEWGVSYEFAQENSDYIKNLSDYISTRDKKKKQKISKSSNDKIIYGEKYYIQTNTNEFLAGPIVFSDESIDAALTFARELMVEFKMQDSVKLKVSNKKNNNIEKKRNGRPCKKNPIRTSKIYVSIGRLKSRKYYTEIVNENKNNGSF